MAETVDLAHQFYDMLLESQWWSPSELQSYQRSQISQLLRHAKENAPFYEHRLDAVMKPNGDIDWDRWGEIPILKRQDIVEHGAEMLARELPNGHGGTTTSSTSGTSGTRITLTSTQLAHIALNGNRFRYYGWHDIDWRRDCCSVFGDDPNIGAWPDGVVLGPWGPAWDVDALDGTLFRINRLTPYDQIVEFVARRRPAYLTTGANTAAALASTARQRGIDIRLDAFLPHGAGVTDEARKTIATIFGAPSIDLYSSKEAGHIAHACPDGEGMHVNAESLLVEILDDDGRAVPPGLQGHVVITAFFNAAQPLIRYDQGDLASWGETCSCGRHLPNLSKVVGRSAILFRHPDGRLRSSFMGAKHRELLHCRALQVAQVGPTLFEVRYVPLDPAVPADEATFASRMRELYFDDAEVSFRRVENIPVASNGKAPEFVNEWQPTQ